MLHDKIFKQKIVGGFLLFIMLFLWQQFALASSVQVLNLHIKKAADAASVVYLDFVLDRATQYHAFSLDDPSRIAIDLEGNAVMAARLHLAALAGTKVKNIRTGLHENGVLRIVLDLTRMVPFHVDMVTDKKSKKAHLLVRVGRAPPKPKPTKKVTLPKKTVAQQAQVQSQIQVQAQTQPQTLKPQQAKSQPLDAKTQTSVAAAEITSSSKQKSWFISPLSWSSIWPFHHQVKNKLSSFAAAPSPSASSAPPLDPKASIMLVEPSGKRKPRDVVIVIDPGHGGKDPGARGAGGTKEKDVVLAIAKDLQNYLNSQTGFSAILTRDDDSYLRLHERLRIAHVNKADMFLSLHADVYKSSLVKGASIFALSQNGATSEAARWLAEKENISELSDDTVRSGHTLRSVLLNLVQKNSIRTSLLMGNSILEQLNAMAMSGEVNLHSKRIEQGAFVVLEAPELPSLLIETGFISDPADELKLRDASYQEQFAKALGLGIVAYFTQHPPMETYLAGWQKERSRG